MTVVLDKQGREIEVGAYVRSKRGEGVVGRIWSMGCGPLRVPIIRVDREDAHSVSFFAERYRDGRSGDRRTDDLELIDQSTKEAAK